MAKCYYISYGFIANSLQGVSSTESVQQLKKLAEMIEAIWTVLQEGAFIALECCIGITSSLYNLFSL